MALAPGIAGICREVAIDRLLENQDKAMHGFLEPGSRGEVRVDRGETWHAICCTITSACVVSWQVPCVESSRSRVMPRGDKSKYTDKQKRQAEHIVEGYEDRGVPESEAERRAWATVNKETGGGNKSGSGRGKPDTNVSSKKGGKIGGKRGGAASAARSPEERSASAKKAAETRKRNRAAKAKG
jgi:plasmid stabilization system protein ParE